MSERRKHRVFQPAPEPLEYAKAAQVGLAEAEAERGRAFLSAAKAGWSVREIGAAVGVSASTAWRIICASEGSEGASP